jgi:hypothetical protein
LLSAAAITQPLLRARVFGKNRTREFASLSS